MIELNKIYQGHALEVLKTFPDNFVDTCPSSPPYWAIRDYGTPPVRWPEITFRLNEYTPPITVSEQDACLGMEPNPVDFIAHIVAIYREVRRVLKPTGTAWMNFGDGYAASNYGSGGGWAKSKEGYDNAPAQERSLFKDPGYKHGIKNKDLIGMPWLLAFALRADGWYLRSDIIWAKPNPMPESVSDRPTKGHEYIFLLAKSSDYFYDAEAIKTVSKNPQDDARRLSQVKEEHKSIPDELRNGLRITKSGNKKRVYGNERDGINSANNIAASVPWEGTKANKRTVWTIPTQAYPDAHFATFPEEIPFECIKAGASEYGCCNQCGAPYERIVEKELVPTSKAAKTFVIDERDMNADAQDQGSNRAKDGHKAWHAYISKTTGWQPTCKCIQNTSGGGVCPSVVLDMFSGSGTTFTVARKLNRDAVAIELNPAYITLSDKRKYKELGLFNQ